MSVEESTSELAAAVDASVSGAGPDRSLRRANLRFIRTVALSVGIQGPTAGVIVGPAVLAGIVGSSGALAEVLALVAMAFVAYAFVIFSRSFNTARSVYAFNGAALGPSYGFVSAWLLLLVYTSFAGAVYASTADIAQTLLASLGLHLWWVWIALAGWALTMFLVSMERPARFRSLRGSATMRRELPHTEGASRYAQFYHPDVPRSRRSQEHDLGGHIAPGRGDPGCGEDLVG